MPNKLQPRFYIIISVIAVLIGIIIIGYTKAKNQPFRYKVSKPVYLEDVHNKTIEGLEIRGAAADGINLLQCSNITIKNCRFLFAKGNGVQILNSKNVTVINCFFENTSAGVYAYQSSGVNVSGNRFRNMQGPFPKGQMVQFNEVTGAGNKINYNKCQNVMDKSYPEDAINLYKTYGTAASPVEVTGNRILGGGPSKSGGGIMVGDNGGAYVIVKNNILVNPGQYGIGIAGGTNISVTQNIVFGKKQPFTNVGIYIWNQHSSGCSLNTVSNNKVNWTKADGEISGGWNQGNCGPVAGWETNNWAATVDSTLLPAKLVSSIARK
jgi:hypothetical protein